MYHSLCLDSSGIVFSAGNNKHGELGRKDNGPGYHQVDMQQVPVKKINAGFQVSYFIDAENDFLYSCGSKNGLELQSKAVDKP